MRALVLPCFLLLAGLAHADEATITVTVGNDTRSFRRGELLARPDATTIQVARDVTYRVPMAYRAVSVASLNLPQNPTEYLTPQGLHDLIRNPRAVRTWPAMAMPPSPPDHLSDRELGLVVAYLKYMVDREAATLNFATSSLIDSTARTASAGSWNADPNPIHSPAACSIVSSAFRFSRSR